ncbi:excalibur calcium-binding domain-containing protein [Nocardioides zhouii]|uniref:Calcium-binding protein n=1 Tax=Nocardioides zhouii TaxID=1168729 RepID=A0A4Q2T1M5_9ACTN|nr:excalibur calcium-binding domain-containing protein [Nocardioides zhouii]RYC10608.1 calcium-binding protein [Nocardioides zhouii]
MTKTSRAVVAALALAAPLLTTTPAEAAVPKFPSCAALTAKWPHGVAKGPVAAAKAVRDGYSRPATTALAVQVYWMNNANLDRDKDGTACENG